MKRQRRWWTWAPVWTSIAGVASVLAKGAQVLLEFQVDGMYDTLELHDRRAPPFLRGFANVRNTSQHHSRQVV